MPPGSLAHIIMASCHCLKPESPGSGATEKRILVSWPVGSRGGKRVKLRSYPLVDVSHEPPRVLECR
ncbi:hypothetical protein E2C01_037073 [Portunus trituberculatus]|uniref:Uncharacterized protein n=1 Tax=Portunus trituberculatus TaxID=210409 RepID=A0A5B7FDN1_PORTR|nr:hypothetical protein [Portunus trituberculatus]